GENICAYNLKFSIDNPLPFGINIQYIQIVSHLYPHPTTEDLLKPSTQTRTQPMNPSKLLTLTLALVTCVAMIPASADTIFQIASDTADSNTVNSYVGGVNFDPSGAPAPEHDYVNAEYVMQTSGAGATFGGNSLTLGDG